MNERFIRCSECGMPHEERLRVCPATGKAIIRPPPGSRPKVDPRPEAPKPPPRAVAQPRLPARPRSAGDFELIGTLLGGKYRIRAVLGEGGMGSVFDGLHEGLGNLVAIKVLHSNQLHKKDSVKRFQHEARAAARIGHPNICEVYDFGALDDGRPYLVMERLVGETLAQRIAAVGGLPVQDVLDTLTQVLSGLHAAHEKGIIHRDIKPENVFLTQRVGCAPIAKILDFGVSKVMSQFTQAAGLGEMEVTRTGVVLGTPYYLAPEQARGERNLDARVDLYACGVMLYEALTGRRPFRAANYNALLIAILSSSPRPAREVRPDLPSGFGRILSKAIERDPANRYQTALEFQAALQPYSHNTTAPTASAPTHPPRRPTGFPPKDAPPPRGPDSVADSEQFVETMAFARPLPPLAQPRASRQSAPPPLAAVDEVTRAIKMRAVPPRPAARGKASPTFDDQSTEVDLPRHFRSEMAERAKTASRSASPPSLSAAPTEAFAPRRAAPIMGPPLKPPVGSPFVDESATEIMSVAVRPRREESPRTDPASPPRPPTRPPRR